MTPIRVHCDDTAVQATTAAWLAGAAPATPDLDIDLRLVDTAWAGADTRAVLPQPGLRFHYGPPDHSVRLVWRDGVGHAWLPQAATRATLDLVRTIAVVPDQWQRPFLLPAVLVLLRRVGWHHIHAATARDPAGRGWLIAGDSRAGKSTTAALLASRGWAVGTDDTALLMTDGATVSAAAWREPIALRDGGRVLLAPSGGVPLERRHKTGFTPEDLGGTWWERGPIDIVAVAKLHDGATRMEPLKPAIVAAELLSWSRLFVLEPDHAQQHLDLVAQLVRQADCFRLLLGPDLFDHPDLLGELVP